MTVKVHPAGKFTGKPYAKGWYAVAHYKGKRKALRCESQEEANKAARYLRVELEVLSKKSFQDFGGARKSRLPTFRQYSTKWLKEAHTTDRKETTVKLYAGAIRNHLNPTFGKLALDEITYAQVKAMCINLQATLSAESIRSIVSVARLVMKEAEREGLIASNPIKDLGRYFGQKKAVREADPFSVEELVAILEASAIWPYYHEFITLSAKTGLRFGEARTLQWDDFDFGKRQVLIRRNWPVNGSLTTPKTAKSTRRVDTTPELTLMMRQLKKSQKALALRDGKELDKWVFPSHTGHVPISHSWFVRTVWRRVQEKAEVRVRNWHSLRHTFATHLLMAGVNPMYVSQQLGHAKTSMTMDIYAHWVPEDAGARGVDVLDRS